MTGNLPIFIVLPEIDRIFIYYLLEVPCEH